MRIALLICLVACVSACGGTSLSPSDGSGGGASSIGASGGGAASIAGTWNGTVVSSNDPDAQLTMVLTQSGSDVSGTWNSSNLNWQGQVSGAVSSSSFAGKISFSGTVSNGTVCTGSADVVGSAGISTMSWTSANGVVGAACPAPLPVGLKIDLQKQ